MDQRLLCAHTSHSMLQTQNTTDSYKTYSTCMHTLNERPRAHTSTETAAELPHHARQWCNKDGAQADEIGSQHLCELLHNSTCCRAQCSRWGTRPINLGLHTLAQYTITHARAGCSYCQCATTSVLTAPCPWNVCNITIDAST